MTADERDLTPEQEAELSAMLADAGGPAAAPPEVVARLDDVLAGLVAERAAGGDAAAQGSAASKTGAEGTTAAGPVSLEAERRRRWPRALLAAAAVVAGGYGVGAALTGTTMSGESESAGGSAGGSSAGSAGGSAGGSADAGRDEDAQASESAPERDAAGIRPAEAPANGSSLREGASRLRSDHLAEDVVRLLDGSGREPARDDATVSGRALLGAAAACLPPGLARDETWYLVRYDGLRAALVAAPAAQGTVEATVLGCDGERLDAVTVPAE
jgi:hypothetical protein